MAPRGNQASRARRHRRRCAYQQYIKHQRAKNCDPVQSLNQDILNLILDKLSHTDLGRCKNVSPDWRLAVRNWEVVSPRLKFEKWYKWFGSPEYDEMVRKVEKLIMEKRREFTALYPDNAAYILLDDLGLTDIGAHGFPRWPGLGFGLGLPKLPRDFPVWRLCQALCDDDDEKDEEDEEDEDEEEDQT